MEEQWHKIYRAVHSGDDIHKVAKLLLSGNESIIPELTGDLIRSVPKTSCGCLVWICYLSNGHNAGQELDWFNNAQEILLKVDITTSRLVNHQFAVLVEHFGSVAKRLNKTVAAAFTLRRIAIRFAPSGLSKVHTAFLRQCKSANTYLMGLKFLESNQVELNPEITKSNDLNYRDVLLFYYFAGIIYAKLKQYSKAIDNLSVTCLMPGLCVSKIQVKAYNKLVLLHLIDSGTAITNKQRANNVSNGLPVFNDAWVGIYTSLAEKFTGNSDEAFIQKWMDVISAIKKDDNYFLHLQVLKAYRRHRLIYLPETFVSFRIQDLKDWNLPNDEAIPQSAISTTPQVLLMNMINSHVFNGRIISKGDGQDIVEFFTLSEQNSPADQQLRQQITKIRQLNQQLEQLDWEIGKSDDFQRLLELKSKNGIAGGSTGSSSTTTTTTTSLYNRLVARQQQINEDMLAGDEKMRDDYVMEDEEEFGFGEGS